MSSSAFAIKVMCAVAFILMFVMWLIMFHPVILLVGIAALGVVSAYCILWLFHRIFIEKKL